MIATRLLDIPNSEAWMSYYEHNREHRMPLPWDTPYCLTPGEKSIITRSLQQFQLGETSEGRHVIECARRYAERSGDMPFVEALRLFVKEEQRHSGDLARFMEREGMSLAHAHWVDTIFRRIRKLATLEIAVVAMLTAELIAFPYYTALRRATASPLLREICHQLLRDEAQHVRFQTDALAKLRRHRAPALLFVSHSLQRLLFAGTLVLVWQQHRPVLEAGGFTFARFWSGSWRRYRRVVKTTRQPEQPRIPDTAHVASNCAGCELCSGR